jgi:hypothetical protein
VLEFDLDQILVSLAVPGSGQRSGPGLPGPLTRCAPLRVVQFPVSRHPRCGNR